jgi:hypothetical protein
VSRHRLEYVVCTKELTAEQALNLQQFGSLCLAHHLPLAAHPEGLLIAIGGQLWATTRRGPWLAFVAAEARCRANRGGSGVCGQKLHIAVSHAAAAATHNINPVSY